MISEKALQLIIDYEVGGGKEYYDKFLARPSWPGGHSGVTIGIGYDLGYERMAPWQGKLPESQINRLMLARGKTAGTAKALISGLRDIVIPWETALEVFQEYTLPREIRKAENAFPGFDKLHPDVQGVLVSLVYNRGTSMIGRSRAEMREIRSYVQTGNIAGIADALKRMKRLWPNLRGLKRRRDAEAALVRATLNEGGHHG